MDAFLCGILPPTLLTWPALAGWATSTGPGDPELARALVEAGTAERVPVVLTEEPALPVDPGALAGLRRLAAAADVPSPGVGRPERPSSRAPATE